MIKQKKLLSLGLLLTILSSCGRVETYVPKFNTKRGVKYSADIGARLKVSLQDSSVEYLKADIGSIFSPLSLTDAAATAASLAADDKGLALASKLGYQSVSGLKDDVKAYRDYFSFVESKKDSFYRGRLNSVVIIPKEYDYKTEIKKYGTDIGLASLKSGNDEYLEKEVKYVKDATFDMFNKRWSKDNSVTLASSFAYQSAFDFAVSKEKVDFKKNKVDGIKFTADILHNSFEDYFILSVPFNKERLVFYVPNGDLSTMFTKAALFDSLASLKSLQSTVMMPQFSITALENDISSVSLASEAKSIGGKYTKIFPDKLLDTLSPESTSIIQNNSFVLSEKGISAASATIINTPVSPSPTTPIVIDKPFVFALMDAYSNPLIIGKVNDLS